MLLTPYGSDAAREVTYRCMSGFFPLRGFSGRGRQFDDPVDGPIAELGQGQHASYSFPGPAHDEEWDRRFMPHLGDGAAME